MSYVGSGQLPIEHASKIGHMKFIQDAHIQRMLSTANLKAQPRLQSRLSDLERVI